MSFFEPASELPTSSDSSSESEPPQENDSKREREEASSSSPSDPCSALPNSKEACKKRRRFPHVEGAFATMVFIPIRFTPQQMNTLNSVIQKIQLQCSDFESLLDEDLHISLSKTFTIEYNEKETLLPILTKQLASFKKLEISFGGIQLFLNEDHSRTFVSIEVATDRDTLISIIRSVDQALLLHKKEPFHADPRPHVSIGWIPGDQSEALGQFLSTLKVQDFEQSTDEVCIITCRIGKIDHPVWASVNHSDTSKSKFNKTQKP